MPTSVLLYITIGLRHTCAKSRIAFKQVVHPNHAEICNGSLVGHQGQVVGVGDKGGLLHNTDLRLVPRWLVEDGHGELGYLSEDLCNLGPLLVSLQGGE